MFLFRVIGFYLYKPQPPSSSDKYSTADCTLIIPTIDTDEEAMHEAMRSWVLNEPQEILIVTVGANLQKELQEIARTSIASDITKVLTVEAPANKRIQLVCGTSLDLLMLTVDSCTVHCTSGAGEGALGLCTRTPHPVSLPRTACRCTLLLWTWL